MANVEFFKIHVHCGEPIKTRRHLPAGAFYEPAVPSDFLPPASPIALNLPYATLNVNGGLGEVLRNLMILAPNISEQCLHLRLTGQELLDPRIIANGGPSLMGLVSLVEPRSYRQDKIQPREAYDEKVGHVHNLSRASKWISLACRQRPCSAMAGRQVWVPQAPSR